MNFPSPVLAIKGRVGDGGELTPGDGLLVKQHWWNMTDSGLETNMIYHEYEYVLNEDKIYRNHLPIIIITPWKWLGKKMGVQKKNALHTISNCHFCSLREGRPSLRLHLPLESDGGTGTSNSFGEVMVTTMTHQLISMWPIPIKSFLGYGIIMYQLSTIDYRNPDNLVRAWAGIACVGAPGVYLGA